MNPDRQFGNAANEAGTQPYRITDDFDMLEALGDFFPDNTQLHFSQSIAHAAMYAEAER